MALIWNAAAGITRSNGNLTITNTSTFASATTDALSGKIYVEITMNTVTASPTDWPQTGLVGQTWLGSGHSIVAVDAVGIYNPGGFVDIGSNGADIGTLKATALANGDVLRIAADIPNKKSWMAIGNGSWNGQVADPAAGTNGFDFSGIGSSFFVGNIFGNNTGNQITLNAGATPFSFTVPTGFSGPDDMPGQAVM